MSDDISASGWLVILCALALGFGVVRFMIVATRDKMAEEKRAADARTAQAMAPDASAPLEPHDDELDNRTG